MYALHQLSRKYPDFLIADENEERVKDFRLRFISIRFFTHPRFFFFDFLRLRYLYRGALSYTTQLKTALNGKTEGVEQDERVKKKHDVHRDFDFHFVSFFFSKKKTRLIAYKICSNVQVMIRDLCRSPPSFKSNVVLSWKPTVGSFRFSFRNVSLSLSLNFLC